MCYKFFYISRHYVQFNSCQIRNHKAKYTLFLGVIRNYKPACPSVSYHTTCRLRNRSLNLNNAARGRYPGDQIKVAYTRKVSVFQMKVSAFQMKVSSFPPFLNQLLLKEYNYLFATEAGGTDIGIK